MILELFERANARFWCLNIYCIMRTCSRKCMFVNVFSVCASQQFLESDFINDCFSLNLNHVRSEFFVKSIVGNLN